MDSIDHINGNTTRPNSDNLVWQLLQKRQILTETELKRSKEMLSLAHEHFLTIIENKKRRQMKNVISLSLLLLSTSLTGFCTVWTIKNSANTFTPETITINYGDTVSFVIATAHNAVEVSQATWNANGNSALVSGFQTAFGGGMVLPEQLGVGTHYYVCSSHATAGMKGTIIVQNPTTSIAENQSPANLSVYPNPSNGQFEFTTGGSLPAKQCIVGIFNVLGEKIYQSAISSAESEIDVSNQPQGVYFVKLYTGQAILTRQIVIQ